MLLSSSGASHGVPRYTVSVTLVYRVSRHIPR
jgi:hypothetical protein